LHVPNGSAWVASKYLPTPKDSDFSLFMRA